MRKLRTARLLAVIQVLRGRPTMYRCQMKIPGGEIQMTGEIFCAESSFVGS